MYYTVSGGGGGATKKVFFGDGLCPGYEGVRHGNFIGRQKIFFLLTLGYATFLVPFSYAKIFYLRCLTHRHFPIPTFQIQNADAVLIRLKRSHCSWNVVTRKGVIWALIELGGKALSSKNYKIILCVCIGFIENDERWLEWWGDD